MTQNATALLFCSPRSRHNAQRVSDKIYNAVNDTTKHRLKQLATDLRQTLLHLGMHEYRLRGCCAGEVDQRGGYYWASENVNSSATLLLLVPGR